LIGGAAEVSVVNQKITNIMNRHLKSQDILACQEEPIDAGFEDIVAL
jgi:hypothetical protein